MKSALSALIFFVVPIAGFVKSTPADSAGVYWIILTDKGPDQEPRIMEFQKSLPERTVLRRRKAFHSDIVGDSTDLPVFADYKDSLCDFVSGIREESRWLNAISAYVKPERLSEIKSLSFVSDIVPVRMSNPNSVKIEQIESWNAGEITHDMPDAGMDYGASFRQLEQVGVIWAHEQGYHGEGVLICFLDTGFLTFHHALNHMDIVAEYDFIHDDDFVGFDPAQDLRGQPNHGTATLATIGGYYPGELVGPAYAASYILCKTEQTGSETAVEEDYYIAALEWGEMLGADLASSSLSYSDWYSTDDYDGQTCLTTVAANIAFEKGMILCSSMGNEGPGKFTLGAPADSRLALGIGAVNSDGDLAGFSSWGPTADGRIKPDICAQGVAVIAATPYTTDGFSKWNGTSLSCPLAAGVVALVIQAHPDWDPYAICDAVRESADRASRPDIRYGWGIVSASDAINYPAFSGYIVDKATGNGIIGKIDLQSAEDEKLKLTAMSDSSGFYTLANLEAGDYLITISSSSYVTVSAVISVPPSAEMDFALNRQ